MKKLFAYAYPAIAACFVMTSLYSCAGNETTSGSRTTDSAANAGTTTTTTTTTTVVTDSAAAAGNANGNTNTNNAGSTNSSARSNNSGSSNNSGNKMGNEHAGEPTGPVMLSISSPAFGPGNVIPAKYTCDGQGATPPIKFGNIPPNTASLALIVHDYEANPQGGFTYWIIWNIDTTGGMIPENFVNNHEGMNAAKQYGYTPICAKSGNHRYHFIVYALDSKLVLPKTTTKAGIESVMRGHVTGKGELVGIYNKHLE